MSRFFDIHQDAAIIGLGAILCAGFAYNSYKVAKKFLDNRPPKKWRKVGEVSELWCFPIKSCGPVKMVDFNCNLLGPNVGHLRDRVFVVARLNGEATTARTYPKMVRIIPKIEGNVMTVTAPGMPDIKFDFDKLYSLKARFTVKVWRDFADCLDCGDEAAKWFSKYILDQDEGLRFGFYPSNAPKPYIDDKGYLFPQADDTDTGTLQDETSYMLMSQSSFDELNKKIEKAVTPLQYRPNIVVKGAEPWEEDNWKWVKIGNRVLFRNVQPCMRCIFTNINPVSGERDPNMEPLKTLKTFRAFEKLGTSPWFGIHLGARVDGVIKMGDEVYVEE